jgi:hypothetical protein
MSLRSLLLTLCLGLLLPPAMVGAADSGATAALNPDQQQLLAQWQRFCDSLKATGERIVALDQDQAINTAEGFHYLAMLTGMAIERVQGYQVPAYPVVARTLDAYKKMGLDSSDNTYRTVNFEPGGEYRIRGWRGNSTYLGFQINAGISAVGNLNDSQMTFNEDGSFELYLGGDRRGGNWLALPAAANSLYIREIFIDWDNEQPSRVWIERLDLPGPPAPLTVEEVGSRLQRMAAFVDQQVDFWNGYVERARSRTNALPVPRGTTGEGGSADNLYSGGYFRLAPDEALLIETDGVEALFWNVQLGNAWFQSLDYQYRQTSLNSHQARRDSDGRYRVVVAHSDPGVPNWLDTAGHPEGVIYYRWNQARQAPGAPRVQVVKFEQLARYLPADTPRVSADGRRESLRRRYAAVARRMAL